ncbi:hypothetical protein XHV734_4793 [Xanthomonas hortorum pv. vitians]|nr:hypothetical protein XHV734_4793 [Xanthomonas hortorum pv. vitians]
MRGAGFGGADATTTKLAAAHPSWHAGRQVAGALGRQVAQSAPSRGSLRRTHLNVRIWL